MNLYFRRRLTNYASVVLSSAAMAFGLFWLFWILFVLFKNGFAGLAISLFTQTTPAPAVWG